MQSGITCCAKARAGNSVRALRRAGRATPANHTRVESAP
ncbi:MAG: hypothetical protein AVDCRST_MAG71-1210 [uncultured Lysobacter sp.]|uniref:Uncharacterized protein n=1 Tax=uncultured Lysobacter sp. TaxID=271060 RepID=A0A6J4L5N4_9GAMM|nr:MAG: hypothetical protein AVDCRST_MAG71-1210 [uncultured Lysobacter sp.]